MLMPVPDSAPIYLSAADVKCRYGGCSDMWLHRRLKFDNFPQPIRFTNHERARRFWVVVDLDAWDAQRIARAMPENVVPMKRGAR